MTHRAGPGTWMLLTLLLAATTPGRTAPPPFDFSGHWTGELTAQGELVSFTADFAGTGSKTFAGTATAVSRLGTVSCTVRGKRRKLVVLRVKCDDGTKVTEKGLLDIINGSIAGSARLSKHGHHARGTFTLSKDASAS